MGRSEAKRLKELDKEKDRLERLVAEFCLDNRMLKDIALGKVGSPDLRVGLGGRTTLGLSS